MTTSEPYESHARAELDQLVVPIDGAGDSITEIDKEKAFQAFWNMTDDVLLAKIDEASGTNGSERRLFVSTKQIYRQPDERYAQGERFNSMMTLNVSETSKNDEDSERSVSLSTFEPLTGSRTVSYVATSQERIVRRIDEDDETAINWETTVEDNGEGRVHTKRRQSFGEGEDMFSTLAERLENYDLEVEMGFNKQPVEPEEVDKLAELVFSSFGMTVER